jgi:hypothetical protein
MNPSIGPPIRRDNQVTVLFDTDLLNNRPSLIIMRPVRRAGEQYNELQIMNQLAHLMQQELYRLLRLYLPTWSTQQIRNNFRGSLMMYNWDNEGHTHAENISIDDINGDFFDQAFQDATANGSNPDLQIYDVEWKVWINPNSLEVGGQSSFTNIRGLKGIDMWNKKLKTITHYVNGEKQEIKHDDIGCATFSLALGRDLIEREFIDHKKSRFQKAAYTKYVYEMQNALKFPDPKLVTVEQLRRYYDIYPDYRLVILTGLFNQPTIMVGSAYLKNDDPKLDKTIYIYHDLLSQHFVTITGITNFIRHFEGKFSSLKWCCDCCTCYNTQADKSCNCGLKKGTTVSRNKILHCSDCGEAYYKNLTKPHICGQSSCKFCKLYYKLGEVSEHRCPLYLEPSKIEKVFVGDENEYFNRSDKKQSEKHQFELWAWDLESHFVMVEDSKGNPETTMHFPTDKFGHFVFENTELKIERITKLAHLGNYIYAKNVFTGVEKEFTTLESFIEFATITNNDGYNYMLAHNSSGYDSRLLFEVASKFMNVPPEPIFKGTKFMQLKLKNAVFQDTLLHLKSSLKKLGESFKLKQTKGYFPHLFSSLENLNYSGSIPDIKYFDLTFSCTDEKEYNDFLKWHQEWTDSKQEWNFIDQRKLYCRNDVVMLAEIMKLYHYSIIDSLKNYEYLTVSPWFFPTMAGHIHKLMIRHLHEGQNIAEKSVEELQEYAQTTLCAIEPEEHYYAKTALRGGLTNIVKYRAEGTIHYVDIQSSYPSVSMDIENLYPVGSPIIEIHDSKCYPCVLGSCYPDMRKCRHTYKQKRIAESNFRQRKLKIKEIDQATNSIEEYCANFFGVITVDITPPKNLYHPLICPYNEKLKKVIGTLEPIINETIPSCILQAAIKIGYKVTKIYRADRYKSNESIFRNGLLGDLYISKMRYAGALDEETYQRQKETFKTKFNIDYPEREIFEENKVRKELAKGPITAAWGKHAESLDHPKAVLYSADGKDGHDFYDLLLHNKTRLTNVRKIGGNVMFQTQENRSSKRPELHKAYLPLAVFVTAYGRLKLWEQLVKIDPPGTLKKDLRVIMYDTDSIIYLCKDTVCNRNPETHAEEGDCLGDWETEKIEKFNKGIIAFYAIGPKSYTIICGNGTSSIKLKGASIKHAHSKMLNETTFRDLLAPKKELHLPQMSFDHALGKGEEAMTTRYYLKRIAFNEKDVKGTFDWTDFRCYPIGFKE